MRVLLSPSRRRDEDGAVAVMVAFLVVTLCLMGAFVVDFGMAYTNKNVAQAAADAGALAAAKVYVDNTADCTMIETYKSVAFDEAEKVRSLNMPNSEPGDVNDDFEVICDTDGAIKVTYDVQAESPLGLGQLATDEQSISVDRSAAAKWGTSEKSVGSMRPWMICGSEIPSGPPFEEKVVPIYLPDGGHQPPVAGSCGVNHPGNWWKTSCLNASGSHGTTVQNILVGCDQVTLAPLSGTAVTDPALRGKALIKDCNPAWSGTGTPPNTGWVETTYCLKDDTGNDSNNSVQDAWDTLLGETIAMPVFCDSPNCAPSSVPNSTQALWPVWKIAAVTICGYDLKGNHSPNDSAIPNPLLAAGECSMKNTDHLDPSMFDNAGNQNKGMGFLVIFKGLIENGGESTFPVEVETTLRLVE